MLSTVPLREPPLARGAAALQQLRSLGLRALRRSSVAGTSSAAALPLHDVLGRATAATRALVTLRVPAPWAIVLVAGLSACCSPPSAAGWPS